MMKFVKMDQVREYSAQSGIAGDHGWRKAYIALGSNVGDRLDMIEKACRMLEEDPDIRLRRTSSLYETEPMYVTDQASFLNGACQVGDAVYRDYSGLRAEVLLR